jgi:non-specific serine/threonine protein kinase/serine/threonine-protein kinase
MTRETWQRVKEILNEALDVPAAERGTFLDGVCNGDAEMRAEVESLLASHADAGTFIEPAPPVEQPVTVSDVMRVGSDIGPYRIVQRIAEGGMGAVYQAVRVDDLYRKVVAIKVIRRGVHGDYALRHFDTERQILAHLDHAAIAKLLDGGTTPDGRPYFVMDFIAGTAIDEYCDRRKLGVRERLALFQTVCGAVHYAHQNLVIHRDIKPPNILITEDGAVKLLDFGIAKLLDPDALGLDQTLTTLQAMTPEYASPEQLAGSKITTASDVYALGVLLFRLLTGRRPYALGSRGIDGLWDAVKNREPRRPSEAVRAEEDGVKPEELAAARGTTPERLSRQLAGDLDTIALMALRKEPERRYCSAEQFATDIRRHVEGHPVTARPDTIRYRAGKFIRRHRGPVAALMVAAATLVAGIIATSWQANVANRERARAERRFQEVRGLAHSVLFELHDSIVQLPGSTQTRELLVKRAQQYLDSLAGETGGDASLQRERAAAYERIGDVLGLPSQANLGKSGEALESYRKALEIEQQLAGADAGNTALQLDIARVYNRVCRVQQSTGAFQESVGACQAAERIHQEQIRLHPDDEVMRAELATTEQNLSGAYGQLGDWKNALDKRTEAMRVFEELYRAHPENESYLFELATAYHRMAGLQEQRAQYSDAHTNAARAVALFEELSARHPKDPRQRLDWTFAQQRLGSILISEGDLQGALDAFQKVLPIREQLCALDPNDARAQSNLANSHAAIGVVLLNMGNALTAQGHFEQQRKIAERLVDRDPVRVEHRYSLSEAFENLGRVDLRLGRTEEGRSWLARALRIYDELSARGAVSAEYAGVPARIRAEIQAR